METAMIYQSRSAVITGAAGRIGIALAGLFAKQGVKLFLTDIDKEKLDKAAEELQTSGADVHTYFMDVSSLESITTASEQIFSDAGRIDILVNNAGRWPKAAALETSDEEWLATVNLNLHSVFRLSKLFGEKMKQQNYGRIINIGSIAGICGLPGFTAYSASKAGVLMLTKTMAMELAKCGVTVNSVSPGMIKDSPTDSNGTWLGYTGTGIDVANAVLFLAADDSGYITGTDITVDGGRVLGPLNPVFK